MPLILLTLAAGVVVGLALGGHPTWFPSVPLRWWGLAAAGIVLQLIPLRGDLGFALLLLSYASLLVFAFGNLRAPGLLLVTVGLVLNTAVIALNHGMPVTVTALARSGQIDAADQLTSADQVKHRLASGDEVVLALGDVLPVGGVIGAAVSVGDVCIDVGVAWFVASAMLPRRRPDERSDERTGARADERSTGTPVRSSPP